MGWRGAIVAACGSLAPKAKASAAYCAWSIDSVPEESQTLRHRVNDDLYLTLPVLPCPIPLPENFVMNKPADHVANAATAAANTVSAAERIDASAERVKQATSDTIDRTKDAVDRAAEKVESSLHNATDKAAYGATLAAEKAEEAKLRGKEAYGEAVDTANDWLDTARDYVREKPVQSIALAIAAGWLAGRILRS
jgi:ElaB/YqjD/DUF883 family membrane-anchored ribosome-binding protein